MNENVTGTLIRNQEGGNHNHNTSLKQGSMANEFKSCTIDVIRSRKLVDDLSRKTMLLRFLEYFLEHAENEEVQQILKSITIHRNKW